MLAGYRYSFPFLKPADLVCTDDNHVAPLYKHVFAVAAAPTLAFIGLPWKCLRYVLFELQVSCQDHCCRPVWSGMCCPTLACVVEILNVAASI